MKKFLISTPIKLTWPEAKNSILVFTSESAILSSQGNQNKYKKIIINDYRWSDKKILGDDIMYLDSFYEKILTILSSRLNIIHSKNFSINFWRILIGPWLATFLHIFFERWKNIENIKNKHNINKCIFLKLNENLFIPYDNEQFINLSQNDLWNQFLYQKIIKKFLEDDKIETKLFDENLQNKEISHATSYFKNLKKNNFNFREVIFKLFNLFSFKRYRYFFYNTFLGFKNELKLSIIFKQSPIYFISDKSYHVEKTNKDLREGLKKNFNFEDRFEKTFTEILSEQLPKLFLENFSDLDSFSKKTNIPQNPKIIFTSGALWYDTKISYHIGMLKESDCKLFYGQHGGAHGISKYHWPESHEKIISDKYLSWGWSNDNHSKVQKFFILKNINKKNIEKNNLLITLKNRKRYFHSLESSSGTELYSEFIKHVSHFLFGLKTKIKKKAVLRLPYKSLNPKDVDFFSNLENNFNFYSKDNIETAYNNARLIIHPSNSTPFLETISLNLPSIVLLNKKNNPFRDTAEKYMDLLYRNNILFYDPKKAAELVNTIWDRDIENWWKEKKRQKAIRIFSEEFANKSDNLVLRLEDFFKKNENL